MGFRSGLIYVEFMFFLIYGRFVVLAMFMDGIHPEVRWCKGVWGGGLICMESVSLEKMQLGIGWLTFID